MRLDSIYQLATEAKNYTLSLARDIYAEATISDIVKTIIILDVLGQSAYSFSTSFNLRHDLETKVYVPLFVTLGAFIVGNIIDVYVASRQAPIPVAPLQPSRVHIPFRERHLPIVPRRSQ